MTSNSKRLAIAVVTTPWVVIVVSALWSVWHYSTAPRSTPGNLVYPDPAKPLEFVLLFSLYGVPTAYLSLAVFLPLYLLVRRLHVASYPVVIALGLLTCLPAAFFYGRPDYVFMRTLVFLVPYGVGAALYFHWIATRGTTMNAEPCAAPNGGPATQLSNSNLTEGPPSVS